tara:strand:+ start:561 stop:1040 length:480 start_codon:yes stop_codon:yes gene_type:complete
MKYLIVGMVLILLFLLYQNRSLPPNPEMTLKINKYLSYIKKNYSSDKDVQTILNKYKGRIVYFKDNGHYTGYISGHGREIGICSKSSSNSATSIDDMMFVFLHELSHCACQTYEHDDNFWKKFEKIERWAMESHIIDMNKVSKEICSVNVIRPLNMVKK